MLCAEAVAYAYDGEADVLSGVSLAIAPGSLTGIIGPNGSGKTTLLRLLAGLDHPRRGRVTLDDAVVAELPRRQLAQRLALVPQETHVAFDFTVLEMVLMGRYPHLGPFEIEGPDDLAHATTALEATGTAPLASRPFTTLSGGEKQRVVIAGALAQLQGAAAGQGSRVLLLDEPTASLDLAYQLEIASLVRALRADGVTVVVSTHDLNLAASVCTDLVLLQGGRVLATGPTDDVLTEHNVRTLYGVEVAVMAHTAAGHALVVPIDRGR